MRLVYGFAPADATLGTARASTFLSPKRKRGNEKRRSAMIRKLSSGEYRLYSRKTDPKTGHRRNLGTFKSREAAENHEREIQYFKRH
jgi:hypothetical protein